MILNLGGNKLGGTITDDIAAFTKLTELRLFDMDLKGTFVVLTPVRVALPLCDGTESEISHVPRSRDVQVRSWSRLGA